MIGRDRAAWRRVAATTLTLALGSAIMAGCAEAPPTHVAAAAPSVSSDMVPVALAGTPGGDFADLPALTVPMTVNSAVAAARAEGTTETSTSAASATTNAVVLTYGQLLKRAGVSGQQLDPANTVVVVTVYAELTSDSMPHPPGAKTQTWPQYTVAYDARTGYTLYLGPKDLSKAPATP